MYHQIGYDDTTGPFGLFPGDTKEKVSVDSCSLILSHLWAFSTFPQCHIHPTAPTDILCYGEGLGENNS